MPAERTIETKGARTVHVRTAGYEKERVTVMLAVTARGLKLPPYVIFKCKTIPKVPIPAGVVVRAQEKGWMDEGLVQDWITQVLVPFLKPIRERAGRRREALVVLDSYRSHLTEAIGQTMRMFRLTRAVIPGGCTPLLQPLDVSVNRAFKAGTRHCYGTWFEDIGINTRTRAGEMSPAETVLKWIDKSWQEVPKELIRKSFVTCGISTKLDGSEDHLVLAHLRDKGEVEVLEDVNEMVEDEVIPNPYFEEARVPAEVLQADDDAMHVEQDEEDADAEDGDGEGYGAGEDGDADEWSEAGSDWWLPDRFDGEEVEEWNAGDEE
ncbi:unnamed protein product [Closterium sp. NIES-53]